MRRLLSKFKLLLIGVVSMVVFSGCSPAVYQLMRAYQGAN